MNRFPIYNVKSNGLVDMYTNIGLEEVTIQMAEHVTTDRAYQYGFTLLIHTAVPARLLHKPGYERSTTLCGDTIPQYVLPAGRGKKPITRGAFAGVAQDAYVFCEKCREHPEYAMEALANLDKDLEEAPQVSWTRDNALR